MKCWKFQLNKCCPRFPLRMRRFILYLGLFLNHRKCFLYSLNESSYLVCEKSHQHWYQFQVHETIFWNKNSTISKHNIVS